MRQRNLGLIGLGLLLLVQLGASCQSATPLTNTNISLAGGIPPQACAVQTIPNHAAELYYIAANDYYQLWRNDDSTQSQALITASRLEPKALYIAPNGNYALQLSGTILQLINLSTSAVTRLDEHVTVAAWSKDSRTIMYGTTDGRSLRQQFRVTGQLDPAEPVTTALAAPIKRAIIADVCSSFND